VRETRGFTWRGVTFCTHASLVSLCPSIQSLFPHLNMLLHLSRCACGWWKSGWTYVALVEADGNAGLLLDFLGHRGGRWSMSSMEVRTSNSNFPKAKHHPLSKAQCGAISVGSWRLRGCLRRAEVLDWRRLCTRSTSPHAGCPSIAGDLETIEILLTHNVSNYWKCIACETSCLPPISHFILFGFRAFDLASRPNLALEQPARSHGLCHTKDACHA
jgi:hypothetical protein